MENEYVTFSIRIPKPTAEALEAEAVSDHRTRNQLIGKILSDRYKAHAPPHVPTNSKQTNTQRASSRK